MKDLAIIILCYNSRELLEPCLTAVQRTRLCVDATVYVVDNASSDGTCEYVRSVFPWSHLIRSHHNGGYSYGNNLALKAAGFPEDPRFRYVMLLNPDAELQGDTLRKMIAYMDRHQTIGVLGPKVVLADGTLDKACKRGIPTPQTAFFHFIGLDRLLPRSRLFGRYNMTFVGEDEIADVDSTVGACQLVRSKAVSHVGLMDESFFMYGEDLDLNLRIRQAGYRVVYYPTVVVKHLKGTSTRKDPERMIRSFHDAMKVFHRKHFAQKHSSQFNWLVYQTINLICQYKMLQSKLVPRDERVAGSAPIRRS